MIIIIKKVIWLKNVDFEMSQHHIPPVPPTDPVTLNMLTTPSKPNMSSGREDTSLSINPQPQIPFSSSLCHSTCQWKIGKFVWRTGLFKI